MKSLWTIVAILCMALAGVALWRQHLDAAFVIATLGVVAWFLNYRSQIKTDVAEANAEAESESTK
jgi:hypothetical protein